MHTIGIILPARSAPVKIRMTPGIAEAADVSIPRILACASVLWKMATWAIPGSDDVGGEF